MENLEKILGELYELDPSLKNNETQIREIILKFSSEKPEVRIDQGFILKLREELEEKTAKKPSFLSLFKRPQIILPLASLTVLVFIVLSYKTGTLKPTTPLLTPSPKEQAQTSEEFLALPAEKQVAQAGAVKTFSSKDEFINYLNNSAELFALGLGVSNYRSMESTALSAPSSALNKSDNLNQAAPASPDRYSQTNTQITSIDEPDIIKTDGKNLFISSENYYYYNDTPPTSPMSIEGSTPDSSFSSGVTKIAPPYNQPNPGTSVLKAFPAEELKKIGKLDKQGNLLLFKNFLVIFSYQGIYGYDIKTPENPKETWFLKYENNTQLSTARLYKDKIYFVTQNNINYSSPCPLRPLSVRGTDIEIACQNIYHPIAPLSDSVTYNVFSLDPASGEIKNKTSFLGSYSSAIYMSENNLFVSYTVQPNTLSLILEFLNTNGKDLLPEDVTNRLNKLQSYDISTSAKLTEVTQIFEKYYQGLDSDERLKKENDFANRMSEYVKENQRKLVGTGIVKISLENLKLEKTGQIPGSLLNQFSLDEHNDYLRAAVTIDGNGFWWGWGFNSNQESLNDVYILNNNLEITGSAKDLGKGERIYSTRFIEDKAYVVTFKQTDPFYVIDLKDPKKPEVTGELKIPGFSSYLHPLEKNIILGIGQENGQVKLSLFNISDPKNPVETDKYLLKEYWSEAQNNHKAFLQDKKHQVFFLPGGQNGYIFSYKNNKLELTKAVSAQNAKRAVYINDMLYIIGNQEVMVLNENNWEKVKELNF